MCNVATKAVGRVKVIIINCLIITASSLPRMRRSSHTLQRAYCHNYELGSDDSTVAPSHNSPPLLQNSPIPTPLRAATRM